MEKKRLRHTKRISIRICPFLVSERKDVIKIIYIQYIVRQRPLT